MAPSVLFVSPWLHDGGIERNLEVKAPWFAHRGHRVGVASWRISRHLASGPNPVLQALDAAGVPVHELSHQPRRFGLAYHAARTALLAVRHGYRVIVGHESQGNVVAILASLLLAQRVRAIAELHNALAYPGSGLQPRDLGRLRRLYPHASRIVAVSDGVAAEAVESLGLSSSKLVTVHNPFRPTEIVRRAAEEPAGGVPAAPFVVACGRLAPMKGFADLVHAFAEVHRRHPTAQLLLLGDGPERESLARCASEHGLADRVSMPGFVANPFPYFARAAAFVVTSHYGEAFSRVLVEAMACGVPVIASRCRWGPEEVLEHGRYGQLYDVGAVDQLARALVDVLDHPVRWAAQADAARRRAADFSEEFILPRLARAYFGDPSSMACARPPRPAYAWLSGRNSPHDR